MGSVLWKHKREKECEEERKRRRQRRNDEDLQSGKTRNGNKNHIFTGAWRLRRTSHLSTRQQQQQRKRKREGVRATGRGLLQCGVGSNGVKSASWHAKLSRNNLNASQPGPNKRNYVFFINSEIPVGLSLSLCLPLFLQGSIRGVHCAHALSI